MRILNLILFSLLAFGLRGQVNNPVIVYNPDSVKLQGRYDFGGTNSDMGKVAIPKDNSFALNLDTQEEAYISYQKVLIISMPYIYVSVLARFK